MITVIFSTREPNPIHIEHIKKSSGLHNKIEVLEFINNNDSTSKYFNGGESLTKIYNRGLKQAKNDIVVFCHDDIIIETKQWGNKLIKQFDKNPEYGIIGVAGTKQMPSSGQWWENRSKMYGRVAHTSGGKTWLSTYSEDLGTELEEVVIVDGVFFAVDKRKIKSNFNEEIEGFHFYDINFCFENYLNGVKVAVSTLVRVNHQSIGQTNEAWEINKKIFAEKFANNLPVNIKKKLRKGEKLKVLIGSLSIKTGTKEGDYVLNLVRHLVKNNCSVTLATNVETKLGLEFKQLGVKVFPLQEPPGFKLGDGKWSLNSQNGPVLSQNNVLYKVSETHFDVLHTNQKPVSEHLLRLFPELPAISTIHSTDRTADGPIIDSRVKKYISINNEVKDVLVDGYNINSTLVIDNDCDIINEYKDILD